MKSLVLAAAATAVLAVSAQAGQPMVSSGKTTKNVIAPETCFGDTELQLDLYGAFSNYKGDTGWGGGLALNYFINRNIGLGVDVNFTDTDGSAWVYSGHLIARLPMEGSFCWAPYAKISAGVTDNDTTAGFIGAGGGIEFRFSPKWGFFTEGSYNWACADEDFAAARAGFRLVF